MKALTRKASRPYTGGVKSREKGVKESVKLLIRILFPEAGQDILRGLPVLPGRPEEPPAGEEDQQDETGDEGHGGGGQAVSDAEAVEQEAHGGVEIRDPGSGEDDGHGDPSFCTGNIKQLTL